MIISLLLTAEKLPARDPEDFLPFFLELKILKSRKQPSAFKPHWAFLPAQKSGCSRHDNWIISVSGAPLITRGASYKFLLSNETMILNHKKT